jgi:hypothetical protein
MQGNEAELLKFSGARSAGAVPHIFSTSSASNAPKRLRSASEDLVVKYQFLIFQDLTNSCCGRGRTLFWQPFPGTVEFLG